MRRNELTPIDLLFGKSLFDKPVLDFGMDDILPSMRTDIKETEKTFEIAIDVPGMTKDNITIEIKDEYLTVSAKVEKDSDVEKESYIRKERYSGSQTQRIYVGDIKEEDVKASVSNGVLLITINKPEKEEPKKTIINID